MQLPALDGASEELIEAERTEFFWDEHWAELVARFPDQFVAVRGQEVVAAGCDLEELLAQLRRLGLDPEADVAIEYLRKDPATLIV